MQTVVKLVIEDAAGNRLAEEPLRRPWRRADGPKHHAMLRDAITKALRGALFLDMGRLLERLADQMEAKSATLRKDAEG